MTLVCRFPLHAQSVHVRCLQLWIKPQLASPSTSHHTHSLQLQVSCSLRGCRSHCSLQGPRTRPHHHQHTISFDPTKHQQFCCLHPITVSNNSHPHMPLSQPHPPGVALAVLSSLMLAANRCVWAGGGVGVRSSIPQPCWNV